MLLKSALCKISQTLKVRKKKIKHYKISPKILASLLVGLMVLSVLCSFLGLLTAQNIENRVTLTLEPLLDKYGIPAINEDGTFYPNDQFEITYHTELTNQVNFEKIEINYDQSTFHMFNNSTNFGEERTGGGSFEVLPSALAGVHSFVVEVWGNQSTNNDDSGTESYVIAKTTLTVTVVEYDPHFTIALTYTVPTGNGSSNSSSYEKPFTIIIRYDGNGPDRNLRQRAVVDDYVWEGYAQKMPEIDTMNQTLTPNITVANFFNQSSNTQFLVQGINDETKNSQIVLTVDGKHFTNNELPAGFLWETNTEHNYIWTQTLPIDGGGDESLVYDEWFEWQTSIVFPPSINPNQTSQTTTMSQEDMQNQLVEQFNSSNGTLTTSPFGNTVTAMYAHNKRINLFAKEVGVEKNQTLNCLTPTPLYFTSQERYAKLQYALDTTVAKQITKQGFTNTLYYNLTLGCNLFGTPKFFEANTTCEYEFFNKPFNATAYKWDTTLQTWSIDPTVNIETTFTSALNFTTTDILRENFETQTNDKQAIELATADLYDCGPQTFQGTGTIEANLKRTSPLYYNLIVEASQKQKTSLQRTIELNFRNNKPYNLPLNFDAASPLQAGIIADDSQSTLLMLDAPVELGGLTNVTIYLITKAPTEKTPNNLSRDQLELRLLKTLNLTTTLTEEQIKPSGYEKNYQQFYQYYEGYSSISEAESLGFFGQTQIAVPKDKGVVALTDQNEALFYVEATNVWGTSFHQVVSVQPYAAPKWEIPLNQVTIYLAAIVIIAIITSFTIYLIRTKQQ
ncbi:MAG: hypothetical protein FWG55_00855 [Candidatus Bathyarchaeota archaeon]|nr:hypothetical protein [Candidatus Termiticorpusculum sp.]